jgi:hypothetical protein
VTELVRVARDNSAIIASVGDGEYVIASASGSVTGDRTGDLRALIASGSWRRPLSRDRDDFKDVLSILNGQVVIAAGGVAAPAPTRTYRVPPTVRRAIAEALEAYSSLLSDGDREIATRLATHTSVSKSDIEWMHRFYVNVEKALALHGGKRGQAWAAKAIQSDQDSAIIASAFEPDESLIYFAAGDDPDSTEVHSLFAVDYGGDVDEEPGESAEPDIYQWVSGQGFQLVSPEDAESLDFPQLIEVDPDTARAVADWLDGQQDTGSDDVGQSSPDTIQLQDIDPLERNLFELAESEIDWEHLDRVSAVLADATGYSPAERSQNAQRQQRQQGGKFGGPQAPQGDSLQVIAKARLTVELPVIDDVNSLLDDYLASVKSGASGTSDTPPEDTSDLPVIADAGDPTDVSPADPGPGATAEPEDDEKVGGSEADPLYIAVVDSTDKTAVLDAVALVPDSTGDDVSAYVRKDGKWTADPSVVADLRGATPPAVVQLPDEATVKDVLAQIDSHDSGGSIDDAAQADAEDAVTAAAAWELAASTRQGREAAAKKGYALPDGSFPITTVADLKKAIRAYGRASNKAAVRRHIRKRARALGRTNLIPEAWSSNEVMDDLFDDSHLSPLYGEHGELVASVMAAGVPGVSDTPSDARNAQRLKDYWTHGEGAAKVRWNTKGDLTRCHQHLTKYVGPERAWGLCQNYHEYLFGMSNAKHDKMTGQDK